MLDISVTDPNGSWLPDKAVEKRRNIFDASVGRKHYKNEGMSQTSYKLLSLAISICGHYLPQPQDIVSELRRSEHG